ncbi:FadR/GntR family transcriptional regulator [Mesorhizobium xinjiangense]|uniref:FadR/GntR family transcriptional regulator n=1 Tax=Mesorhizobium xinjiangense TaxID=2678685 RepID=UPI0012ED480D|nr:FadR/GntR family transcriptional regulator [Mesorhizobium xinjiangense]
MSDLPAHGTARDRPARRPRLADALVDAIRMKVVSGALAPGTKLPTENQLCKEHGVSRTVVREAIARLSADGLVQARQGAGVFVREDAPDAVAEIFSEIGSKVSLVLNVLEVRMAVEIESAGLAAQRRSASQQAEIHAAFAEFEEMLRQGKPTGAADFAFHRAIATATNNPFYVEMLDVLGRRTIPRDLVTTLSSDLLQSEEYLAGLQAEHGAIMQAVAEGDPAAAREAMRAHLSASQRRYQALLQHGSDLGKAFTGQVD